MTYEETINKYWNQDKNTLDPWNLGKGGVKNKAFWDCDKGHTWEATIHSVTSLGSRCPYCSGIKRITGVNDLKTLHPDLIDTLWLHELNTHVDPNTVGPQSTAKVWWGCENNHEWESPIAPVVNGRRCPYCQNRKVLRGYNDISTTHPDIVRAMWSRNNEISPEDYTRGSKTPALWVCEDGHEWVSTIKSVVSKGSSCPVCSGHRVLPGFNDLASTQPELVAELWNYSANTVDPSSITMGSGTRAHWSCGRHTWESTVHDVVSGHRCPVCVDKQSVGEGEVYEYLRTILPPGATIHRRYRGLLGRREVDLYLPEYGLGIEYNGAYYHSTKFRSGAVDNEKRVDLEKLGVRYYGIWDDDWATKRKIIEDHLRNLVGAQSEKVYARNTYVDEISGKKARDFLTKTHLLGAATGSINISLRNRDDDRAVAVMVLKRRDTGALELSRYSTSMLVPGGHSKLISYVERNYSYSHLVTFADLSVSRGDLYRATGWTEDRQLPPDYMYVQGSRRVHKFNYRKARFRDDPGLKFIEGATEKEMAELNNLHQVYDCGKIRFIKPHPSQGAKK